MGFSKLSKPKEKQRCCNRARVEKRKITILDSRRCWLFNCVVPRMASLCSVLSFPIKSNLITVVIPATWTVTVARGSLDFLAPCVLYTDL